MPVPVLLARCFEAGTDLVERCPRRLARAARRTGGDAAGRLLRDVLSQPAKQIHCSPVARFDLRECFARQHFRSQGGFAREKRGAKAVDCGTFVSAARLQFLTQQFEFRICGFGQLRRLFGFQFKFSVLHGHDLPDEVWQPSREWRRKAKVQMALGSKARGGDTLENHSEHPPRTLRRRSCCPLPVRRLWRWSR